MTLHTGIPRKNLDNEEFLKLRHFSEKIANALGCEIVLRKKSS